MEEQATERAQVGLVELLRREGAAILREWGAHQDAAATGNGDREQPAPVADGQLELFTRLADALEPAEDAERNALAQRAVTEQLLERAGPDRGCRALTRDLGGLRDAIFSRAARLSPAPRFSEVRRLDRLLDGALEEATGARADAAAHHLGAIERISACLVGSRGLEDFLSKLLDILVEGTSSVEGAAILLRDRNGLQTHAAVGLTREATSGFRIPLEGFAGMVVTSGKPLLLPLGSRDPQVLWPALRAQGLSTIYVAPIIDDHAVIGLAYIGSRSATLSETDTQLFAAVVRRAGAAIGYQLARVDAQTRAAELEAVIDSIPEAVLIGTLERIERMNPAAESLFASAAAHPSFASLCDRLRLRSPGGDQQLSAAELPFARALRGEESRAEVVVPSSNGGRERVLRCSAAPVRRGGRVVGAVAIHTDVTDLDVAERERAQLLEQMETERATLEGILEQLPVAVMIAEAPSGRISWVNRRFGELVGGEPVLAETVAEYDCYVIRTPGGELYAARDMPLTRTVTRGEVIEDEEVELARIDGAWIPVQVSSRPVRDSKGQVVAAVVILADLRRQKRAEGAQRFLAQASAVLAETLDLETTASRITELAVPALADCCAVDLLENGVLRGVALTARDPHRAELFRKARRRHPLERVPDRGPAWVVRTGRSELAPMEEEGIRRWITDPADFRVAQEMGFRWRIVVPLTSRGRTLGTLSFITAESGRAYTNEDLEAAEELGRRAALALDNAVLYEASRHATRMREEVLAVVSHDLRTPLGVIGMSLQMLHPREGSELPPEKRDAVLARMGRAATQMTRLINDLLDIGSIESGRLAITQIPVETERLIRSAHDTFLPLAREENVQLRLLLEPSLPPVSCDQQRALQVFANLLNNAIKVTPPEGTVTLAARRERRRVRFEVTDTGPGVPEKDRELIFERFRRGSQASYEGTGLGLAICRGIIEAHGGEIGIAAPEELPDGGARFWFTLPTA